jgi:hypothetical protein
MFGMLRKTIFGGLTVLLAAALVWLIINGRREEARIAAAPTEVVKTARSSSTRIVAPKDLVAVTTPDPGEAGASAHSLGRVEIQNRGSHTYHNVMLRFTYLAGSGKLLDSQTQLVQGTIEPGQTFFAGRISTDNAPSGASSCNVSILYSELGPAPLKAP